MQEKYTSREPYYSSPNNYGDEGEDHLNINIHAKTQLGKVLDPNYIKVINYPHIGKFSSVKSLWHWLHSDTREDKIRKLVGSGLTNYVKEQKLYGKTIPNFKAIIGHATWIKLQQYPECLEEIKALSSEKAILSYYVHSKNRLRVVNSYASVMINITIEIRNALLENREPNFNKFADRNQSTQLFFLHPYLSQYLPSDQVQELLDIESSQGSDDVVYELTEPDSEAETA